MLEMVIFWEKYTDPHPTEFKGVVAFTIYRPEGNKCTTIMSCGGEKSL